MTLGFRPKSSGPTLFLPRGRTPATTDSHAARALPADLRLQVTRRLRLTAILYSLAFFLADVVSTAFMGELGRMFSTPAWWLPTMLSIAGGLLVAAIVPWLSWNTLLNVGLLFEVASSYGIALAQYLGLERFADTPIIYHGLSPSWVAVWMIVFAVVVPAPPGRSLIAILGAASAPPVVIGLVLRNAGLLHTIPPGMFFIHHVFTYLICAGLAYASARIVYRLGADVTRARNLGSYHLVEKLGSGGMGEVWRASHQLLARPAAIKFIRPEAAGANPEEAKTVLKRFELEARATASLTSSHTIDLYDYGATDDGTFYYVMELLDGLDCERWVRRFGPLPGSRIVYLLRQACESLEEAHDKGLIHRDVKPANLYVCRSGNRCDFIKVLDFGLVSERRAKKVEPRLTMPELTVGTPEFMPPEVARGEQIDGRADLYGLGCVAYWLATGKPVFEGASHIEVISKHLHSAAEPPSRLAPHAIPRELDEVILRCLEKRPQDRPADARQLARMLSEVPFEQPWGDDHATAWWGLHLPADSAIESEAVANPPRA
jgi:eukaryotic-like serine/threonine-protein kinase